MLKPLILLTVILAFLFLGCVSNGKTIEITKNGFVPKILNITVGDTVTFINKDDRPHWPASANHPTHAQYPEEGGCIGSKFDSCGPLKSGETFSFTFNQPGLWGYHDHTDSSLTGTVIVE
ncbi:hypothetical protein HY990_03650 [Candidatus Micrarchaeota archaeon]|nr:hypothetical protein [Candidatus Micrarchaeota archaeon]